MSFSVSSSSTLSAFLLLSISGLCCLSSSILAEEITLEGLSVTSSEKISVDDNKIDWSKPIVSRGFGLDESQGEADNILLTQYQSGQVFYFFGEYDKAVEKWLPLLEENFPEAQASMGWMYQTGVGVDKNEKKAFQLYTLAAKNNNAIAQNNLGVMYENGIAVKQNIQEALRWYKRSAEQGYRFGQYNYANMLLAQNAQSSLSPPLLKLSHSVIEEAKRFLKKAAAQGVIQAKAKLETLS